MRSSSVRTTAKGAGDGGTGFMAACNFMSQMKTLGALGEDGATLKWSNFNEPTKHTRGGMFHEVKTSVVRVIESPDDARKGFGQGNTGGGK